MTGSASDNLFTIPALPTSTLLDPPPSIICSQARIMPTSVGMIPALHVAL